MNGLSRLLKGASLLSDGFAEVRHEDSFPSRPYR